MGAMSGGFKSTAKFYPSGGNHLRYARTRFLPKKGSEEMWGNKKQSKEIMENYIFLEVLCFSCLLKKLRLEEPDQFISTALAFSEPASFFLLQLIPWKRLAMSGLQKLESFAKSDRFKVCIFVYLGPRQFF